MEASQQFELIKQLQEYLMNINTENFEEAKNFIIEDYLDNDINFYFSFFRTYLIALMYRPSETEMLLKLLFDTLEKIESEDSKKELIRVILETVFHLPGPTIAGLFVLYHLYRKSEIDIEEIIREIRNYRYHHQEMKLNLSYCYIWFGPEIGIGYQHFLSLLKSDYDEYYKNNRILSIYKNFNIDLLHSDNYKMLNYYRNKGHNHSLIYTYISNDDVNSLQTRSVDVNFNYNDTINASFFEISPFIQNDPTLIELSAFYGSINCFKYLLLNDANLLLTDKFNENLADFAVAGNNVEIIRICYQKKIPFTGTSQIAALFHRNEILAWLTECENQEAGNVAKNNGTIIQNSAISNNLETIEMCLENNVDVNGSNSKKTSLQNACENGNIESVILLLSDKNIDVNACISKKNIF